MHRDTETGAGHVDVAIIGGGIAGCYAAYRIQQLYPDTSVLLIEADQQLGGRAQTDMFNGVAVPTGAGVGRLNNDVLLQLVMTELDFPIKPFTTGHGFLAGDELVCTVEQDFKKLRHDYLQQRTTPESPPRLTFRDFASKRLSNYKRFIACTGYSDFEDADAADVFFRYSFDDNYTSWPAFGVPWSKLIAAMTQEIPCLLNTRVEGLRRTSDGSLVLTCLHENTASVKRFKAARVIIATGAATLRHLLPTYRLYDHIHGQPFLRIYGAFETRSVKLLASVLPTAGVTVLPGSPLQKMLPIRDGVYMIAYSDNTDAVALRRLTRDDVTTRATLCRLLEEALRLPDGSLHLTAIRAYYWSAGTHYFDPLATDTYKTRTQFVEAVQRPAPGILVAGECVALHQGWVEGALISVENIL
jgi:choline dehydrogenase-like flavoprotein